MSGSQRRFMVVHAHPLHASLGAALRDAVLDGLAAAGHEADLVDLYREDFDPRLRAEEREAYFEPGYAPPQDVARYCARLREADGIVLVFPQWWFGPPAILKGFIDRVFVPGIAFAPAPEGQGPADLFRALRSEARSRWWMLALRLRPRLGKLRSVHVVTTTGSPRWIAEGYMRNPVRRQIGNGVFGLCAGRASFRMLSLYGVDTAPHKRCARFIARVRREFTRL